MHVLYLTTGAGVPLDNDENKKIVTEMIALEWGRFEAADRDKNGTLSKAEFKAAIFPNEYEYMVDQMVKVSVHLRFYLVLPNLPHKTNYAYMFIYVYSYMCLFLQLHAYIVFLQLAIFLHACLCSSHQSIQLYHIIA